MSTRTRKGRKGTVTRGAADIGALTHQALYRQFSPSRAARLWELYSAMGVSLDTLARASKILKGLGVTKDNDAQWSFYTNDNGALELWNEEDETWVEVEHLTLKRLADEAFESPAARPHKG